MGVRREDDLLCSLEIEDPRDVTLRLLHHHAKDSIPFPVGEPGRIVPRLQLGLAGHVGPRVMRMRGKVQPSRVRLKKSRVEVLQRMAGLRRGAMMMLSRSMRRPILLFFVATLSVPGCGKKPDVVTPDSPLAPELKLLERQVVSLKAAIADAKTLSCP